MIELDAAFRQRMLDVFGDDGREWMDRLPSYLDEYEEEWEIEIHAPYALSYNYVAPATRADGTFAVFKAGVPRPDISHEIAALRHWDGDGAIRVLESDAPVGVFLLEQVAPGTSIIEIDDDEATRIAAGLMRRLWRPPAADHQFPTLADWGEAFALLRARHGGTSGPLPQALFDRGESLYFELTASQGTPVLLHGDLHHWNILQAEREPWLVIDPHGVVGEPAFEVGAWMRNPVPNRGEQYEERSILLQADVRAILARRIEIFAEELGLERSRLRDWSIAFATLSASWSDESGHVDGWEQAMAVAEILAEL